MWTLAEADSTTSSGSDKLKLANAETYWIGVLRVLIRYVASSQPAYLTGTARSACVGACGPPAAGVYPICLASGIGGAGSGSGSGRGGCGGRANDLLSAGPIPSGGE